MQKISIVSPVYNGQECIEELVKKIKFYIKKCTTNFEIILVNDCSEDNSWKKLLDLKKNNKFLKIYNLKKNSGQQFVFRYGASKATGDKIFFLDCDLQHHPKYFSEFLLNYKDDDTFIVGKISFNSLIRKGFISNIFWLIFSILKFNNQLFISNYILASKKIIKKLCQKKEITYLYLDLCLLNFKHISIKIMIFKRLYGKSSYTLKKLFKFAFSLIK
jgi:glycosyltransferase involved in cell wall biosynthesis